MSTEVFSASESKSQNNMNEGIHQDGFGLEIQGYTHSHSCPLGAAIVTMDNGTLFKIRIYNTNHFSALVKLTLDDVTIGKLFYDTYKLFCF